MLNSTILKLPVLHIKLIKNSAQPVWPIFLANGGSNKKSAHLAQLIITSSSGQPNIIRLWQQWQYVRMHSFDLLLYLYQKMQCKVGMLWLQFVLEMEKGQTGLYCTESRAYMMVFVTTARHVRQKNHSLRQLLQPLILKLHCVLCALQTSTSSLYLAKAALAR